MPALKMEIAPGVCAVCKEILQPTRLRQSRVSDADELPGKIDALATLHCQRRYAAHLIAQFACPLGPRFNSACPN
jgi:hypothetical protein